MSKLGVSIIGASNRTGAVLRYFKKVPESVQVVGIYDLIPGRTRHMLDKFCDGSGKVYTSLQEAVTDPEVSAVFVCTPDWAHVESVGAALAAGKNVFCEKPLATTLEDCDQIIDASRNAKGIFYLGMNLRHAPVYEKTYELLQQGLLGKVLTIEANEHYYGGRTYFRRWNRLRQYGGGLWITKACHDFDILNWLAGGNPERVYARCNLSHYIPNPEASSHCRFCKLKDKCPDFYNINTANDEWDQLAKIDEEASGKMSDLCLFNSDKDTFDNGIALIDYDNDIRATYTVTVVTARRTRQILLTGTEGSAHADLETGLVTYWKRHCDDKKIFDFTAEMKSSHGGADDKIYADFLDCCRSGRAPRSNWFDGRLSVQVGLAATQSSDTGMPVLLKPAEHDLPRPNSSLHRSPKSDFANNNFATLYNN
jgi:predicted dehydrogenase